MDSYDSFLNQSFLKYGDTQDKGRVGLQPFFWKFTCFELFFGKMWEDQLPGGFGDVPWLCCFILSVRPSLPSFIYSVELGEGGTGSTAGSVFSAKGTNL